MDRKEEKMYYVAFLDLLGASGIMDKQKSSEDTLNKISEIYGLAKEYWVKDDVFERFGEIQVSIFSDNICFCRRMRKKPLELNNFIDCVGMFQASALNRSLVFRGGLTVGRLYIDDTIIWGDALARAYKLEEKISCYPRIVCDFESKEVEIKYSDNCLQNVKRDFDGMHFVDYLSVISSKDRNNFIEQTVQFCDKQISENDKFSIIKKYEWIKTYLNM